MSSRSGPNGEIQLTPIPIEIRGLGELPRNTSLKPGLGVNWVGFATGWFVSG